MKQKLLLIATALLCLVYFSCRKNDSKKTSTKAGDPLVTEMITWVEGKVSDAEFARLDIENPKVITDGDKAIALQIYGKEKTSKKFIFISKDKTGFVGNWVEHSSMATKNLASNDGIINTQSFDGRFKSELFYKDGKPTKFIKTDNGVTKVITVNYPKANSINGDQGPISHSSGPGVQMRELDETVVLPPVVVVAYIQSSPMSLYSLYYYNPAPAYQYSYVPNAPSGGGGGGGGTAPSTSYTTILRAGNSMIGNITDYIKCFSNVPGTGYTYKVTLCVDQPKPGSRSPWGFSGNGTANSSSGGNPVDVGHTFLVFTQTTPTGTTTRNIGFYPRSSATPVSPMDQGQLNNDEQHPYDVSLTITMTNSQFFTMLSSASQGNNTGFMYDLNNNNCSSYAIRAINSAGFNFTSTKGTWPGGGGFNPGDLGEDIKKMTLPSNMTRSTTSSSHPNQRSCN